MTQSSAPANWALAHQRVAARVLTWPSCPEGRDRSPLEWIRSGFPNEFNSITKVTSLTRPAFRVGQLDTELLDDELLQLLKGQFWNGLKYFKPSFKDKYEPELILLLRSALFKLTLWDNNATYGSALQNLCYIDARRSNTGGVDYPPSKSQKLLYFLVSVLAPYLTNRLSISPSPSRPALTRLLDTCATVHSAATVANFVAFLYAGRYRTLLDRLLFMRLTVPDRVVSREVSFEYLNRQLVWHAFTEFLLFILPLVRVGRWRRWWIKTWRRVRSLGAAPQELLLRGLIDNEEDSGNMKKKGRRNFKKRISPGGEFGFLPERTCAICYSESNSYHASNAGVNMALGSHGSTDVVNPYETDRCGHVYCYICIQGKIALGEGDGWTCLRCNVDVKSCRLWGGSDISMGRASRSAMVSWDGDDDSGIEADEESDEKSEVGCDDGQSIDAFIKEGGESQKDENSVRSTNWFRNSGDFGVDDGRSQKTASGWNTLRSDEPTELSNASVAGDESTYETAATDADETDEGRDL